MKTYGIPKEIEGTFDEGETVLVVDDLITDGGTKIEIIDRMKQSHLNVKDIIVLIDREQGGKETLSEKGYALHSVLTIHELIQGLEESGKISRGKAQDLRAYFDDPHQWQEGK